RYHLHGRVALNRLGVGTVEDVGDIGLAGFQHQGARGCFRDALHHQCLHVRHASPVAVVSLHLDLHARLLADELVGAGTDWMFLEAIVSDTREIVLWHDDAGGAGGRAVERHEIGPRRLWMKAYHQGIDDLDLGDVFLQDLRSRAPVALEAELHVFRRHGVAVVKLQSRTQLELVHLAIRTLLPRFREAWAHLLSGIRADERIVDR